MAVKGDSVTSKIEGCDLGASRPLHKPGILFAFSVYPWKGDGLELVARKQVNFGFYFEATSI